MNQKRKPRAFEILDAMNLSDIENDTQILKTGFDLVSVNYYKNKGTEITIGVGGNVVEEIGSGKIKPMLCLLDMAEYKKWEDVEILVSPGVDQGKSEREKQIDKHGYTAKFHAENPQYYDKLQLLSAAVSMLIGDVYPKNETAELIKTNVPQNWDANWFLEMTGRSQRERIRIAQGLLIAELDRLDYLVNLKTGTDENV